MSRLIKKIVQFCKFTFVCIFMLFILAVEVKMPTRLQEKKCYDLSSATLISVGCASTICLGINSRKKV